VEQSDVVVKRGSGEVRRQEQSSEMGGGGREERRAAERPGDQLGAYGEVLGRGWWRRVRLEGGREEGHGRDGAQQGRVAGSVVSMEEVVERQGEMAGLEGELVMLERWRGEVVRSGECMQGRGAEGGRELEGDQGAREVGGLCTWRWAGSAGHCSGSIGEIAWKIGEFLCESSPGSPGSSPGDRRVRLLREGSGAACYIQKAWGFCIWCLATIVFYRNKTWCIREIQ
jgi:hypothetical protein